MDATSVYLTLLRRKHSEEFDYDGVQLLHGKNIYDVHMLGYACITVACNNPLKYLVLTIHIYLFCKVGSLRFSLTNLGREMVGWQHAGGLSLGSMKAIC